MSEEDSVISDTTNDGERQPYQSTLRAVGRHLDDRSAFRANVLEGTAGFAVRYQTGDEPDDMAVDQLRWDQLHVRSGEREQRRQEAQRNRKTRLDSDELAARRPAEGYENFFRALGHELDVANAYTIALDELDVGIVVCYLFLDPRRSYLARKQMLFLAPKDLDSILSDAYSRRQLSTSPKRSLGIGKLLR